MARASKVSPVKRQIPTFFSILFEIDYVFVQKRKE